MAPLKNIYIRKLVIVMILHQNPNVFCVV